VREISRRELFGLMSAAAVLPSSTVQGAAGRSAGAAPVPPVPVVAEAVAERFVPLALESQQLGGLLAARMHANTEGRLLHLDATGCLAGFLERNSAGHFDSAWAGEHAGKFLDAACMALRYRESEALRQLAEHVARTLLASQEPDGYLGTYPAARRWTGWDVWVHKYNLIGLLSYYELTGDHEALRACHAVGNLLVRTFGEAPGQRDILEAGEHVGMAALSVLEPMCRLYRFTGDERQLEFCRYLLRAGEGPRGPRIVAALTAGASVDQVANGKAYEMLSNLNGLTDLYRLTGDVALLEAVLRGWDDIVRHQLYRTGALSAAEHFQPEGRLLTLQSSNVGEMCVTVTWLQLNFRLLRLTAEARFGHEIERTVFNQLLAAQDARTGDISYYTSWVGPKEFTSALLCCVSSGPRAIALLPQLVWGLDRGALFVNLYAPGRARLEPGGVPVEVRSETNFPADGRVAFTVEAQRPAPLTIRLRVPEWVTRFRATLGGRTFAGSPGRLLDITHTWVPSDRLDIEMDMPVELGPGGPRYPDYRFLQRGPQLLALERSLNPDVPYLHRVALDDEKRPAVSLVRRAGRSKGAPAYAIDALVGVPSGGGPLRLERRAVALVPFADSLDGRVWMTAAAAARRDPPAATAFARASLSVLSLGLERTAGKPLRTDIAEFVTDEDPRTYCTVNPEDRGLAQYLGAAPGRRGDAVWFTVMLREPAAISRIVFRHGASDASGGWFDASGSPPRIEIAREPLPVSANGAAPDERAARWETVALLTDYPSAGATMRPALTDGQRFEVRLAQPVTLCALRVVGRPGGDHASCAELSAYG